MGRDPCWAATASYLLLLAVVVVVLVGDRGAGASKNPIDDSNSGDSANLIPLPTCSGCQTSKPGEDFDNPAEDSNQVTTGAEASHLLRLESIKMQLLSKLRLQHKPNVSNGLSRQLLLDTVLRSSEPSADIGDEAVGIESYRDIPLEDDYYAKTSKIFSFAEPGPQLNNVTLLEFTQSKTDMGSLRVIDATLWVYIHKISPHHHFHSRRKDPDQSENSYHFNSPNISLAQPPPTARRAPRTKLWVFRVLANPSNEQRQVHKLLGSLVLTGEHSGWQTLDVTNEITHWFAQPSQPLRLLVDCSSCSGQYEATLFNPRKLKGAQKPGPRHAQDIPDDQRPFLALNTTLIPPRRLARRALECDKNTERCCKQDFYVSFKELGWDDWILAPSGYQANYCRGSCDSTHLTPDSFHSMYAHLLEELRRVREPGTISHCCAPTRQLPMTLIYIDEQNNIIKRDVPRMVVEECGCA